MNIFYVMPTIMLLLFSSCSSGESRKREDQPLMPNRALDGEHSGVSQNGKNGKSSWWGCGEDGGNGEDSD